MSYRWISFVIAMASFAMAFLFLWFIPIYPKDIRVERADKNRVLQLEHSVAQIKNQLNRAGSELVRIQNRIQNTQKIPDESKIGIQVKENSTIIEALQDFQNELEKAFLPDPIKAITVAILKKDIITKTELFEIKLGSLEKRLEASEKHRNALFGLSLSTLIALGLFALSNAIFAKKEEKK